MQLSRPLSEDETARRYAFVSKYGAPMAGNANVLNVTWISEEAHFHLDSYVYKQNIQFLALENPMLTVPNPQHPKNF
jgi:hypothetical protein